MKTRCYVETRRDFSCELQRNSVNCLLAISAPPCKPHINIPEYHQKKHMFLWQQNMLLWLQTCSLNGHGEIMLNHDPMYIYYASDALSLLYQLSAKWSNLIVLIWSLTSIFNQTTCIH